MTRRLFTIAITCAVALCASAATASADPTGEPVEFQCSNGETLTVTLGPPKNNSSVVYVIESTSIFVVKRLVITDPETGEVLISFDRGLNGFDPDQLVTCEADAFGVHFLTQGFSTPR
jgi:hypothetical protein